MANKIFMAMLLALGLCSPAFAAGPGPNEIEVGSPSDEETSYIPEPQFGSTRAASFIPMPPHLPPFLPNGSPNLDYDWIEDGGARLYWNFVIIPQQLRMDGASWRDPALVPDLFPPAVKSRPVARRRAVRRVSTPKAAVPANAASTALTPPAIPLPVAQVPVPPLRPEPAENATSPTIMPPRLQ